jgi:5-(carboxyamino)imidazole ribonucleotide mutase
LYRHFPDTANALWQPGGTVVECAFSLKSGQLMSAVKVGLVMGSNSDWEVMQAAAEQLQHFGVAFEARVVSAHRTPDLLFDYASTARERGLSCIIAGAGGAAHLPGMLAAKTTLPVLGVPVPSRHLQGLDSLLSIVQMPKGVPVATFAIGSAGAANAALYAISLLALADTELAEKLDKFRAAQTAMALNMELPPRS